MAEVVSMNFFEWLTSHKAAPNYTARAGETIAGNLKRGGDGKFASAASGESAKPPAKKPAKPAPKPPVKPATKPTPKKLTPKKKPRKTRAQYNAERAARKKARLAAIAAAKKKKPSKVVAKPVKKPVQKKPIDPAKAAERQAAEADRKKRRAEADARRAIADQRRAAADERRAARDAERAKPKEPKAGGGGGGKGDKPEKQLSPQDQRAKDLVTKLTAGDPLDQAEQDELVRSGLARRDKNGGLIVTAAGRSKLKEVSPLAVFKDASGRYRWILRSSTAFEDRDKEIVSTKALEQDVDRADLQKSYGPLRFWHIPGWDIGDCDFRMVYGRTLIESGTFRDETVGARVAEKANEYGASLGFLHPPTQPISGVYHTIHTFERSLVPRHRASNIFTGLMVIQEKTMAITKEKIKAFLDLLGGDTDALRTYLTQTDEMEKTADSLGVASKEVTEQSRLLNDNPAISIGTALDASSAFVTLKADTAEMAAEDAAEEVVDDEAVDDQVYLTDLTSDEFRSLLREELAAVMTGASTEATTKAVSPVAAAVAAVGEKQQQFDTAYQESIKTVKSQIAALNAKIADLEGDTPHVINERRASQQAATVTTNSTLKAAQPQPDPLASFFEFAAKPGS